MTFSITKNAILTSMFTPLSIIFLDFNEQVKDSHIFLDQLEMQETIHILFVFPTQIKINFLSPSLLIPLSHTCEK